MPDQPLFPDTIGGRLARWILGGSLTIFVASCIAYVIVMIWTAILGLY